MTQITETRVRTAGGVELSCGLSGDPAGPPLVLVHGYSDSWRAFAPLMARLPASFRVVAVSLRGHGDSDRPDASYAVDAFVADAVQAMDGLGVGRATVLGHSMGGFVAERLAIDHPDRVSDLVLVGAFRTLRGHPAGEALWRDAVAGLADPVDETFIRAFQESTLARPVPPAFLEAVIGESRKLPARVWRAALRAMLDDDFSRDLRKIAAPTTLLWGDRDGLSLREDQDALASAIRGARLVVFRGCGHAPHWEAPDAVARAVTAVMGPPAAVAQTTNRQATRRKAASAHLSTT